MSAPLSTKAKKDRDRKFAALTAALSNNPNPNAASLAASFGLPVSDVEYHLRSIGHGK